jgi:hypothetical protein
VVVVGRLGNGEKKSEKQRKIEGRKDKGEDKETWKNNTKYPSNKLQTTPKTFQITLECMKRKRKDHSTLKKHSHTVQ